MPSIITIRDWFGGAFTIIVLGAFLIRVSVMAYRDIQDVWRKYK